MRRLLVCGFLPMMLLAALAPACAGTITEVWRSPAGMFSPRALSVDARDGSVWVADHYHSELIHIAADGTELLRKGDIPGAIGLAANAADGSVWVLAYTDGELLHLTSHGSELWRGGGFDGFMMVSVDSTDGSVWLGGVATLVHLTSDGAEIGRYTHPSGLVAVPSANPNDGSCWAGIVDTTSVVHVASDGTLLWHTDGMPSAGSVSVDPADGSCWTCGGTASDSGTYVSTVIHFSADGDQLWRRDGWWVPDGGPRLAVNPKDGSCWVVNNLHTTPHSAGVTLVGVDGTVRAQHAIGDDWVADISSDPDDGSLWVALQNGFVIHLVAQPDGSPFWDIGSDHWASDEITACATAGVVSGYQDGLYHPEIAVTRDQMAVFIARAMADGDANVPAGPETATFNDVPTDYWSYKYVEYCVANDVVQGYDAVTYGPADLVARDSMAVFIARADAGGDAGVPDGPAEATFDDVPTDYWCYKYIEYCVAEEIVQGYDPVTYGPTGLVTRDQMAVFITRAFGLI